MWLTQRCLRSCLFATWRLVDVTTSGGGQETADLSWMLPQPTLLSLCEIYIATLVASIPFFWPVLSDQISQIFVKYEFNVSTESRYFQHDDHDDDIELAPSKKGDVVVTEEELTRKPSASRSVPKTATSNHHQDDFVQATVDPFSKEFRTKAAVESVPVEGHKHQRSLSRSRAPSVSRPRNPSVSRARAPSVSRSRGQSATRSRAPSVS
jgi:hypothetical protein